MLAWPRLRITYEGKYGAGPMVTIIKLSCCPAEALD